MSEKCPHEIIMQMQSKNDEDWWFQVWCANDCKWGEAELWMQKRREEVEDRPQKTRTPTLPHPLTLNVEPYNPRILNLINVFLDYCFCFSNIECLKLMCPSLFKVSAREVGIHFEKLDKSNTHIY